MSTPGVVSPVSPLSSGGFGGKVEMVYSLLGMLGSQDPIEKSKTLLTMTQSPEACITMRQSGNAKILTTRLPKLGLTLGLLAIKS